MSGSQSTGALKANADLFADLYWCWRQRDSGCHGLGHLADPCPDGESHGEPQFHCQRQAARP